MTRDEFLEFLDQAISELTSGNQILQDRYDIASWPRWDLDLDKGALIFSGPGHAKLVVSIDVAGTTSAKSQTWMWSWANPSLPPAVSMAANKVRRFGESEDVEELRAAHVVCDEDLGWIMTAVMARIIGACGGYRCPRSAGGFVYVVFKEFSLETES
jgi:hypothetical protein